jgi:excisionase family DNA binding protein
MTDALAAAAARLNARLNTIEQVQQRLNVGRSTVFGLIKKKQLRSVMVGRRRLIPESALAEFIAELEGQA